MIGQKRVNIKQVAREAGVSVQTVSRVLNERPDVSPETRQNILEIIERLDYQPSQVARNLIHGRIRVMGIIGYGLNLYGPLQTFSGIDKEANKFNYTMLPRFVQNPESEDVSGFVKWMVSQNVDGIIWAIPEIGNNRDFILSIIDRLPIPVVFLSMESKANLTIVAIDNRLGGKKATEHLISQKYRKIGHISGPLNWWEAKQRLLGWQDALMKENLECGDNLIVEGDWTPPSGEKCLELILQQAPDIDAVFVANDRMALGASYAARKLGYRIPEDLALIGFDDRLEAAYFYPPLSTIRQDMVKLGQITVRELHNLIEGVYGKPEQSKTTSILIEPDLIVRSSSINPKINSFDR